MENPSSHDSNPYQPPQIDVGAFPPDDSSDSKQLERIAYWQKVVIWSFVARLVLLLSSKAVDLQMVEQPTSPEEARTQIAIAVGLTVVYVLLTLVQFVALANLSRALGYSILMTIALLLLLLFPVIGLIVLLVLVEKATKKLKAAGYEVGFLGVKHRPDFDAAPPNSESEQPMEDSFSTDANADPSPRGTLESPERKQPSSKRIKKINFWHKTLFFSLLAAIALFVFHFFYISSQLEDSPRLIQQEEGGFHEVEGLIFGGLGLALFLLVLLSTGMLSQALEHSVVITLLFLVLLFIPPIGLISSLVLVAIARHKLKEVGFLGVKHRPDCDSRSHEPWKPSSAE